MISRSYGEQVREYPGGHGLRLGWIRGGKEPQLLSGVAPIHHVLRGDFAQLCCERVQHFALDDVVMPVVGQDAALDRGGKADAGAGNAALDRANGDTADFRHLAVADIANRCEDQNFALRCREQRHGAQDIAGLQPDLRP